MNAEEAIVGEDFGQGERLTVRLRGLIRSYPRSVGIIKEFLQNADDAGASRLRMILDLRQHSSERLPDPRMSALQGPSLLFVNDQVFRDEDFAAIRRIGESSKSELGPKTGRFGLGFNTAYNITDYPSFISGHWAVAFDPHRRAVGTEGQAAGRRWELRSLWGLAPDWLGAFAAAGLEEDSPEHPETIFRLPLRTAEHAAVSEICDEPFEREDFDQMVRDLWESGDELLLFARHVLAIEVDLVDEEGQRHELLRIDTVNRDEVLEARAAGNVAVEGPILENLERWRTSPEELPQTTFRHVVQIRGGKRDEIRPWQVCSGLFVDSYEELVRLNEEMVRRGEKAIPWAGAAVRLEARGEEGDFLVIGHQKGKLSCTFPLPEQPVPLPCHLNGCFDLDASRRQISLDAAVYADADRVRVNWNRALLRHALPQAAAMVIASLAPEIAERSFGAFYALWPDAGARVDEPWRVFFAALISRLAELPLVRTRAGETITWERLSRVLLPAPLFGQDLQDALRDDGLALPDPDVPARVVKSADLANVNFQRIRPPELRGWLRTDEALGVPLAEAPRACLRERSHVVDLLQFSVSDRKDDLVGLPLALTADGLIRAFGRGGPIFLADDVTRRILGEQAPWFLDRGLQSGTRVQVCEPAGLFEMGPARVVDQLATILEAPGGEGLAWDPDGDALPNAAWLTDVFRYLAERVADGPRLAALALFPDASGRLHGGGGADLLIPAADLDRGLRGALEAVGVDLVSGAYDLVEAARNLQRRHPGLCAVLTGPSLVQALELRRDRLVELAVDARDRAVLLDYLAEPRWLDLYGESEVAILRALPLWATLEGAVIAAGDPRAFLAGGFRPPALVDVDVALVDVGPGGRWRSLLDRLGVQEMSRSAYLTAVLLPAYGDLSPADQRMALGWFRDEVDRRALDRSEPERAAAIRAAALIRGNDGELHPGHALHEAPEAEDGADEAVLGAAERTPDRGFYTGDWEGWRELFAWLGVRREPEGVALLRQLDAHLARVADDPRAARAGAAAIFRHVHARWAALEGDEALLEALRARAWLSAVVAPAWPIAGFVAPEDRLYRPDELFPPALLDAVASQGPVFAAPFADLDGRVLTALGVRRPTLDGLLAHLDHVRGIWAADDHGGLEPADVSEACAAIYAAIGAQSEDVPEDILAARASIPSIWDPATARFWPPEHAFSVPIVDLFGARRAYVPGDSDDARRGLDRLGRRRGIEAVDLVAMIRSLADERPGEPLDPATIALALRLLRRLVDGEVEDEELAGLLLPTADGRLQGADAVLVDDAPWFSERIDGGGLPLLDPRVDAEVVRRVGPRRLSDAAREVLAERPALSGEGDKQAFCGQLSATIHHPRFARGLARILAHQGASAPERLGERLGGLKIVATDRLVTRLKIAGVAAGMGVQEVPVFADAEAGVVYVGGDHWDTVVVQIVAAIERLLGGVLTDLGHVEAILRSNPDDIPALLDLRRVPRLRGVADEGDAEAAADEAVADEAHARPALRSVLEHERSALVEGATIPDAPIDADVIAAAIARVVDVEREAGRSPQVTGPHHPAYDVQSGELRDPGVRFIRVAGLDGAWDPLRVVLSRNHYNAARTFGAHFWLYVVEHALDPARAVVHRLQDPVGRSSRFVFDGRWRAQGERESAVQIPQVGWTHQPINGVPGVIEGMETVGMFTWVRVRKPDGSIERRFFKPGLDKLLPPAIGKEGAS